jgi:DNA-binding GntR family transcriptional regulator
MNSSNAELEGDGPPELVAAGMGAVRKRRPKSQAVYNALLTKFLSSDVEPGSRITIDALARELGVSPMPVREALGRLELNGLVVRNLNAGYRVVPKMNRQQFENLVEIRLALEPVAARRAAERIDPQQLAALQELTERMGNQEDADERQTYAMFAQLDAQFHDAIAAASQNDLVRDTLARLGTHVRLFRLIYRSRIRTDALAEHEAVLDAIRAGDPEGASYQMRRHILQSAERFRESFDA